MRLFPPLAAVLLIPACAPGASAPTRAPASVATYRAVGTEPGWALTIGGGEMRYQGDYGQTLITVPTPDPRTTFNGHRYQTERLIVDITHGACSDGMSDRRYPDTVMVIADGKTVHGCGAPGGGTPVALAGTRWTIAGLNGAAPTARREAKIAFAADRISGTAGCNSFGGGYTIADGVMTTTQVISTKMACLGPGMAQESAVFAILAQPMTVSRQENSSLVLSDDAGTMTLTPAG